MNKEPIQEIKVAPEARLMPDKHGVIVIHGVGEQKKGDFLAEFTESLAVTLIDNGGTVRVEADMSKDQAEVILHITAPDGSHAEWVCREAYWADSFPPPPARTVIGLLLSKHFGMVCARLLAIMRCEIGILSDIFNSNYASNVEEAKFKTRFLSKRYVEARSGWSLVYVGHVIIVLFIPLIAAIATIFLWVYWVISGLIGKLGLIPFLKPLDFAVKWAQKNIDPFLSKSIGDLSQYVENTVWSASIRGNLEKAIIKMLEEKLNDITIVAHSLGCLVTYEALSKDGKVAIELAELQKQMDWKRPKITLVTLGSALNIAFDIAREPKSVYARKRIAQPLGKEITGYTSEKNEEELLKTFSWMDIYARLDPGPAGQLDNTIIETTNKEALKPCQVERRRVVNMDDLLRDHNSYWKNKEEVMPRIAKAINSGVYPLSDLKPNRKKLVKRVNNAVTSGNLRGLILGALLIFVVGFTFFKFDVLTGISLVLAFLLADVLAFVLALIIATYLNPKSIRYIRHGK